MHAIIFASVSQFWSVLYSPGTFRRRSAQSLRTLRRSVESGPFSYPYIATDPSVERHASVTRLSEGVFSSATAEGNFRGLRRGIRRRKRYSVFCSRTMVSRLSLPTFLPGLHQTTPPPQR
jgi:hypothetical protein